VCNRCCRQRYSEDPSSRNHNDHIVHHRPPACTGTAWSPGHMSRRANQSRCTGRNLPSTTIISYVSICRQFREKLSNVSVWIVRCWNLNPNFLLNPTKYKWDNGVRFSFKSASNVTKVRREIIWSPQNAKQDDSSADEIGERYRLNHAIIVKLDHAYCSSSS